MNILAFGASTSKQSINKTFASYAADHFSSDNIKLIDLNDYSVDIYSIDLEQSQGIPDKIKSFVFEIEAADFIIISFAEHNGSYSAAFKNIFDWSSRYKKLTFDDKNMLLLSTSPGKGGAKIVLSTAESRIPRHGAHVLGSFSLPSFDSNFSKSHGIINPSLKQEFHQLIKSVKQKLQ